MPSLFSDLSQKLHHITPYDFIGVLLSDAERQVMRLHSLETPTPLAMPPTPELSVETSPSGYVWRTQQSLFIDVETETRFPAIIELLRAQGMKALYVTPLTTVNRRLGAMGFGSKDISAYSKTHLSFLQQVARQIAVAVKNALNFEKAHPFQWKRWQHSWLTTGPATSASPNISSNAPSSSRKVPRWQFLPLHSNPLPKPRGGEAVPLA